MKTGTVTLKIYKAAVNFFPFPKFVTSTSITIYGETPVVQIQLIEITEIYLRLWENDDFTVRVFPEKWMLIDILFDVKIKTIKI